MTSLGFPSTKQLFDLKLFDLKKNGRHYVFRHASLHRCSWLEVRLRVYLRVEYLHTLSSIQYHASQLNLLCFEKIVYCTTQRIQIQNCAWHLLARKRVQTTSACSLENLGRKIVLEYCDQVGLLVRRPVFLYILYIQRIFRLFFLKIYWSLLLKNNSPLCDLLSLVSSVPPSFCTIH